MKRPDIRWYIARPILRLHVWLARHHKKDRILGIVCTECGFAWPCPQRRETDARVARFPDRPRW